MKLYLMAMKVSLKQMPFFLNEDDILVARTAGTVMQGTAPVKLMNVGESEVTLQANICLESFYAAVPNTAKVARVGINELIEDAGVQSTQTSQTPTKEKGGTPNVSLGNCNLKEKQQSAAETRHNSKINSQNRKVIWAGQI